MSFYKVNEDVIRDFCEDAIRSGKVPTNIEIQNCVGYSVIEENNDDEYANKKVREFAEWLWNYAKGIYEFSDSGKPIYVDMEKIIAKWQKGASK